ncbi:MAG: hypothetical protein LBG94_10670 [Treponema sp.]|jgi:hypothetical protein|nr:hypothetical protein [Treponema sp.]
MNKKKPVHPAIIAVWAAVVAAGYLLPTFPIMGTGANFSLANILNPLAGIFFGSLSGALCSAVGGFIGFFIAPVKPMLGPFSFIIGMTTAFTSGCIAWGRWPAVTVSGQGNFIFNGGIIVYIIGTILWFTQETGRSVIRFPVVFYGLGFVVMIAGIIFAGRMFASKKRIPAFAAVFLCSFGGLVGGATAGNFFSLVLFKIPPDIWLLLTVTAPIERALFALCASFVGVPLLAGLGKTGILCGPHEEEDSPEENINKDA